MPFRVEVHSGRHDVSTNYCPQKSAPHTLKQPHEASNRSRQKRMRFTSGGTVDDNDGVSTSQDVSVHRPRRHPNPSGARIQKQAKLSNSHPSSPISPCDAADQMDCVRSRGTVVIDTAITGVEQMEDDNSFSSSVFSEHLVQPELQMVISTAPDDSVDKTKSCRTSILTADKLILTEGENKEADEVLVKDMKSMGNLLIHTDSGISTPTLQTTDDAGSSEGEDENDGKDEVLINASDDINLPNSGQSDSDLPSIPKTSMVDEGHNSQEARFSKSDLALLESGSFSHILPTVENECNFVHESTSPSIRTRRLSDVNSSDVTVKNSPTPLDSKDVNPNSFTSLPAVLETPPSPPLARVMTRSQTAELSKHLPSHPPQVTNSRRNYSFAEDPVSSGSSTPLRFRSHGKDPSRRRSVARVIRKSSRGSSRESTCSLSAVCGPSVTCSPDVVGDEPSSISENTTDIARKRGFCEPDTPVLPAAIGHHSVTIGSVQSAADSVEKTKDTGSSGHVYPLRSRLRRESMRRQVHAMQAAPKAFDELPTEVLFRITHYLSIQDVFRLQLVCRRLKAIVERYLLLVKRINFSNGLPFAFLPESINDVALKRILTRTPEVTHILGFYPRHITGSYPSDFHSVGNTRVCSPTSLTYAGIVSAFRICPKLRSVELMDVELMGKLVHHLPRIKFHGMFRNRPDSWDCEYAVPLPSEECRLTAPVSQSVTEVTATQPDENVSHALASSRSALGCHASAFFCSLTAASAAISATSKCKPYELLSAADIKRLANKCLSTHRSPSRSGSYPHASPSKMSQTHTSLPLSASVFAHKCAVNLVGLANWFEPAGESPLGQGSPSTVPHFLPTRSISFGSNLIPWYDQVNLQPVPQNANATGGLDAFRNLAMAPYIQPGLPPIEAELIAAAPIGRDGIPNNQADGAPVALNNHGPVMALAFGAVFISPHLFGPGALGAAAPVLLAQQPQPGGAVDALMVANANPDNRRRNAVAGAAQHPPARQPPDERVPNNAGNRAGEGRPGGQRPLQQQQPFVPRAAQRVPVRQFVRQLYSSQGLNSHGPWLVSPLPNHSSWIGLPHTITNLTKLDLASVAISAIPRLDNIKYLHLKWVVFTSADPFGNFSASKLQSFVMNNCSGPSRVFRFVRIFSALARAPQLMRLELVGTRFVDGLLGHIIDDALLPGRSFRNLQRLVLSSNRDSTETDIGLLLLAGQSSLNHVALQIDHTRNSLFEALACASVKFPRLENMILGYQDPYQSRLTVSELMSLGIGESSDHLFPICSITDWGVSLVFQICPRLTSLTVRHAPYLSSMQNWKPLSPVITEERDPDGAAPRDPQQEQQPQLAPPGVQRNVAEEELVMDEGTNENGSGGGPDPQTPVLRSLTLENCPGLRIESLENALSTGAPFPCLETLVMRDMYMSRFQTESCPFEQVTWSERMHSRVPGFTSDGATQTQSFQPEDVDWSKASHLLALSDLLNARHLGYSAISPEGIGLSSSVREVGHLRQAHGLRLADLPVRPFDLFYSMRTQHYLNGVLELDGSCGPLSVNKKRIAPAFFSKSHGTPGPCQSTELATPQKADSSMASDFVSQSTQTCICGLLELQFMWYLSGRCEWPPYNTTTNTTTSAINETESADDDRSSTSSQTIPTASYNTAPSNSNQGVNSSVVSLGGPLAFHPFPVSSQYQDLNRIVTASEWTRFMTHSVPFATLSNNTRSFVAVDPGDCPGCASHPSQTGITAIPISAAREEPQIRHRPRKWIARDASIDTSELRCHNGPGPLAFTVFQPESASFSNLTSIHFEKVGISHLILSGAPHLKNITLENCPHLQAILFSPPRDSASRDIVPALRRIRVLRCPKFAIYYLLHAVASLYPMHDENVSITYRPFGHYDEQVERALWNRAHHAHVLISHDYKQHESERGMEEFHSSFDQLFREVISFADMLVRRELLAVNPKPQNRAPVRSALRRSEHGVGWNLVTDIPWMHEVCCSTLRVGDVHRSDQPDQFYEVLSEIQTSPNSTKIQRRGIHLHVQYRDVHSANEPAILPNISLDAQTRGDEHMSSRKSYLKWNYTEPYLASNSPEHDLNAWGDGLDESLVAALPPHKRAHDRSAVCSLEHELPPAYCLLLSQEEGTKRSFNLSGKTRGRSSLKRKPTVSWSSTITEQKDHRTDCAGPKRLRGVVVDSGSALQTVKRTRRHTTNSDSLASATTTTPIHVKKRPTVALDALPTPLNTKRRRLSGSRSVIQQLHTSS